jgi:hypothetical protein
MPSLMYRAPDIFLVESKIKFRKEEMKENYIFVKWDTTIELAFVFGSVDFEINRRNELICESELVL